MQLNQARAIIWAQWRTARNYIPRSSLGGLIFSGVLMAMWYGAFAFLATIAGVLLSKAGNLPFIKKVLADALLVCFLYWQVIPILMASMGSSLEMKKLLVYPIPHGQLFTIEVLLRISTGLEMFLLLIGAGIGLLCNPIVPFWAPLSLVIFAIFNLLCSAGVRDLLVRLLARKRVREIVVFLFVLAAALPQVMILSGGHERVKNLFKGESSPLLPWTATAALAEGEFSWMSVAALLGWTAIAYFFGRWQFERGLTFDAGAAGARTTSSTKRDSPIEWFYRLPNAVLPSPLAALVEKELRFLSRSARFRLVFLMGFSFGLLIWAPLAFGQAATSSSLLSQNYLSFVSVYALLLLSDALFWNCFGFDRSAAQVYFLVPFKLSTVFIGKNLAAVFFVFLEISAIALVCALLRLPISIVKVLEAAAVTFVVTLFLLSIGNLSSVYNPRSVNPTKSFRTAAGGRIQAVLMLTFPLALIPVFLAFLARYAFDTEWAFFAVLVFGGMLGGFVYSISMDSAVKAAEQRREQMIAALSKGAGPIES